MSLSRSGALAWPSARDLHDAGCAQIALVRAYARVRGRPVGALVSTPLVAQAAREGQARPPNAPPAEWDARRRLVQRLELALDRAARRGIFRPSCLVRSLALVELLTSRGVVGAEIRIGVRQPSVADLPSTDLSATDLPATATRATLEAHAWVELEGAVVGDDPRMARRFAPLGGVRVVEPMTRRFR